MAPLEQPVQPAPLAMTELTESTVRQVQSEPKVIRARPGRTAPMVHPVNEALPVLTGSMVQPDATALMVSGSHAQTN
jgi:hypothetical protein